MKHRISGTLTHELSHLQLSQDVGHRDYLINTPGWFVEWLHDLDDKHFKQLILHIHDGDTLNEAMPGSYGFSVQSGRGHFFADIGDE